MKIGIITQPLHWNFGGILQNYALQETLRRMGHDPITINYQEKFPFLGVIAVNAKTLVLRMFSRTRRPYYTRESLSMSYSGRTAEDFINKNISVTSTVKRFSSRLIDRYNLEAVIVGSDQVWRPQYNKRLKDMYLYFVRKHDIRKIAYSASFGTDSWEYSPKDTLVCAKLAGMIDDISVREMSAVKLCREHLKVEAQHTLDPTLLLNAESYSKLCEKIPKNKDKIIVAYILDNSIENDKIINSISSELGLQVNKFTSSSKSALSVEEWLSYFRDAAFVITDSYHGTIFSIIFQKDFLVISNDGRGKARFKSLLDMFEIKNHIIENASSLNNLYESINWSSVKDALDYNRRRSIEFIQQSINS